MTDTIKKTGIQLGIALGIVLTLLSAYIYFGDLKLFTNVWMGIFTIGVTIVFGIIAILIAKQKIGGYITFKEAFTAYFFTLIAGKLISCIFAVVISSFVLSAEAKSEIKKDMLEFNLKVLKANDASDAELQKAATDFKNYDPFSPSEIIFPTIKYLLRDCIIGFLVALIFRNKRALTI